MTLGETIAGYILCSISPNMMDLWLVKSPINENTVKALKSIVYISFHCIWLTESVYKQVLRMRLTVNMHLITMCA